MIIQSQFKPAWWLSNAHVQTIWPQFIRSNAKIILKKERLELPDGDFLDLVWTESPLAEKNTPILVLLHGLEGSIHSHYATGILKTSIDNGWQGVFMHFRGCSGEHNRLTRSYHSGETGDLHTFINVLKDRYPERKIIIVGISLSGNVLLKYLGEQEDNSELTAAMAISVPFDLADGAISLSKGFSRIYQWHLITRLQKKFRDKFKNKPSPVDMGKLHEWTDFYSFDHNVTAPVHGFESADDYYTKSSSKQFIKHITTPTLILHSKDDPFLSQNAIPKEGELSLSVTMELSEHGGHVGFIYGNHPFNAKYWIEKRMVEFFKEKLS